MKKIILICLGLMMTAPGLPPPREWTVMVYMCGDNDLAQEGRNNINEMSRVDVESCAEVDVVALYDDYTQYPDDSTASQTRLIYNFHGVEGEYDSIPVGEGYGRPSDPCLVCGTGKDLEGVNGNGHYKR